MEENNLKDAVPSGLKFRYGLRDHVGAIVWLAWSPDGKILASCSADETVNLWNSDNGKLVKKLKGHTDAVISLAWSPDSRVLVSGSYDESIILQSKTGKTIKIIKNKGGSVNDLSWSPDGAMLAAGGDENGSVQIWNAKSYKSLKTLDAGSGETLSVVWSPDGRYFASSSDNGTIKIWDSKTFNLHRQLKAAADAVYDLAWSADFKTLAAGYEDGTIRLWSTNLWNQTFVLKGHKDRITCVKFSSDNNYLASKSFDGSVRLWHLASQTEAARLHEPSQNYWLAGLAFHPNQPILATLGEGDTIIRLWDLDYQTLESEVRSKLPKSSSKKDRRPANQAMPSVSAELVKACADGECVLFVGAGLGAQIGLPTWDKFIQDLLEWAVENNQIKIDLADSLREALANGNANQVADVIISHLIQESNKTSALYQYLDKTFIKKANLLPETYKTLGKISFNAALTTNFDNLLENTFKNVAPPVYTPENTDELSANLQAKKFFILKLYGKLEAPQALMISPAQYEAAISENVLFSQFMENLSVSQTLFFVGASLEGIETYLKGLRFRGGYTPRQHFALVNVVGNAWKIKADILQRRYGIQVIPFTATSDFPEVIAFLKELEQKVNNETAHRKKHDTASSSGSAEPMKLISIQLENIGPFDNLTLEFDSEWNVLLGNNGVGKSSILKAIAVAVAGEDARPFADRLIKSGKNSGTIILELGSKESARRYVTNIYRRDSGAEIQSRPMRPLDAGNWLALGFPALRAITWESSSGRKSAIDRPTSEDLLPLIEGKPDPRLNSLKSWLIDIDHIIQSNKTDKDTREIYIKLRQNFFEIIKQLTPGVSIEFVDIEPTTKRVNVKTNDGVVPIELISQGTISLLGWIGVLLKRYYEVFGHLTDAVSQNSLVLIDELDAHMHPFWQQRIVGELSKLFPNTQFIATTHAPLIVGGMNINQVIRLARNESSGQVEQLKLLPDMTVGSSDQILTSDLFGLDTSMDALTQDKIKQYHYLLGKKNRSKDEQAEYEMLVQTLMFRVPPPLSTYEERHELSLENALSLKEIGEQLGSESIAARGEKLLFDITGGEDDKNNI